MNWISIVGVCCLILGTVLSYVGTYKSSKQSQEKLTEAIQEKNAAIDDIKSNNIKLIDQNTNLLESTNDVTLTNKDLLLQNTEMLDKITKYQTDIEKKNIKIKELEKSINKAYYKPLDKDIQDEIINRLSTLKPRIDKIYKGLEFMIEYGALDSNRNTNKICTDIRKMLIKAGYKVPESTNKVTSHMDANLKSYPVPVFIVNPRYKEIAFDIVNIFSKYITNLKYITDKDYNEATFVFQFHGIPEFSQKGIVTYRK